MGKFMRIGAVCACAVFGFATTALSQAYTANLQSAQEVPTNASTATGYARVMLNEAAGTIAWTVVFNGLSSNQIASHIHGPAAIGFNVGVAINFGAVGGTSGTISGTSLITPTQIAQLKAHQMYVNVHTANFSGGEIRGQLGPSRVVDFDGDGQTDFSVLRFPVGPPRPITYYNFNSTTGFQAAPWGDATTDFPTPGDYDGDGIDELALYRAGATAGAQSHFWILNSSDGSVHEVPWGLNGDIPVNRDYDGDGKTDIAVFRRGAAAGAPAFWYILQSATQTARIAHWGTTGVGFTSGDAPVPDDYDGDGKADLAVYRFGGLSPNNSYLIQRSSDSVYQIQGWGDFTTDYVLPGDYDGDGKADFAAGRTGVSGSSPMVWWILQSATGTLRVLNFGISSDLPTQGDYDGDGRTDVSIYRRGAGPTSQSTFWVFRSLSNIGTPTNWGLGGDFATASYNTR